MNMRWLWALVYVLFSLQYRSPKQQRTMANHGQRQRAMLTARIGP